MAERYLETLSQDWPKTRLLSVVWYQESRMYISMFRARILS